MAIRREPIDQLLTERGVPLSVVQEARTAADKAGVDFFEGIGRMDGVDPSTMARTLGEALGLPWYDKIDLERVSNDLVRALPLGMAREQGVLPLWERDGAIDVALSSPRALAAMDDLRVLYGRPVRPVVLAPAVLRETTNKAYDKASRTATAVMEEVAEEAESTGDNLADMNLGEDLLDDPNQAPIIRFVNSLFTQSIRDRASDIHIEPFEKELLVRFRVDGVLYEIVKPPPRLQASIVSRIKIMAGLNIAEKRIPQDGRIRTRLAGREVDVRVSTMPVRHGERVVMRLLEKGSVFNLERVGMAPEVLSGFRKLIQLPHGIIMVCGPTGSGKTTTLYSALSEINTPDQNILTIEDPVEYEMRGIGQTQVNPKIDLTFASVLRAHLRQDPDVILVGETRDRETAENAIQASLTGHLVFTTIHTNDAPTVFTRITDMGIEPFLVASSLVAILAQRLVRKLCPHCKETYTPTADELRDIGVRVEDLRLPMYRAVGCKECNMKGYAGRIGIYELLMVTDAMRAAVTRRLDAVQLKKLAVSEGMKTLREDGIAKALAGVTTIDEVLRVTQDDVVSFD